MIGAAVLGLSLTVVSLNFDKQCGKAVFDEMAGLIKPDIVLMQEVVDGPSCHTADAVARELGLHPVYAKAYSLNATFDEGLAILSRYPVSDVQVLPLSHHDLHFHTRVRIALALTVDTPRGAIRVVDVHLDNRISSEEKLEQLQPIWEEASRVDAPMLIGGDFNTGNYKWVGHVVPLPGKDHQREATGDAFRNHGFSSALTFDMPPTLKHWRQHLDWIYARKMKAEGAGVIVVRFSDHNAVWTKYEVSSSGE